MPLLNDLLAAYTTVEKYGHPLVSFPTIWHEVKAADVEVVLNADGEFVQARKLERWVDAVNEDGRKIKVKGDAESLTPVTLYSECRTGSQAAPRPLSDGIKYYMPEMEGVAGKYLGETITLLDAWNSSIGGDERLYALSRYLSGQTIKHDIIGSGVLDDVPEAKREKKLEDLSLRFVITGVRQKNTWEDEELIRSWDRFMESQADRLVVDVVTGKEGFQAHKHGKNLLPDNANGKLISTSQSEDKLLHMTGERFTDTEQAPYVTFETSVKTHRMLRWLMKNRSVRVADKGSTTYWTCFSKNEPVHMDFDAFAQETGAYPILEQGKLLKYAINGVEFDLPDDELTVLAMDYSSDGRNSIVYYQSVSSVEFFKKLLRWREKYRIDTKDGYYYPSLRRIILHAFGSYDNKSDDLYVNEAVMKKHLNSLIRCFLEGRDVPENIVMSCVGNVSRTSHAPEVMRNVIATAYVLLTGRGNNMKITDETQSWSFLYGRLLAVFDSIEKAAVYKQNSKRPPERQIDRATNAQRMLNAYVADPKGTAPLLYGKVNSAYLAKLAKSSRDYYDALIRDIYTKLEGTEKTGRRLGPDYIVGYTQQKNALQERSREIKEKLKQSEKTGGNDNE